MVVELQSYIERGLFQFTYGSEDSLVEFLHGDNFVQAHVEAACALQEHNSPVVRLFILQHCALENIGAQFIQDTQRLYAGWRSILYL